MNDRWKRQRELFDAASRLPQEKRHAFLEQACADDSALIGSIEALLAEHDEDGDSISPTIRESAEALFETPEQIGRYSIRGRLGEGAMGVVFEAQQENPRRDVALKVMRGGPFVDESRLKMFQREVATLARLEHPCIAAIYESGHTADGQHFFAMERVRGERLDVYMKRRPKHPDTEELRFRLALFRKIVDAVHYAHMRGVIHRDLKPSNLMVGESVDQQGLPEIKVLDFGLARITQIDMAAVTITTEIGVIKGTLPYMSPEQTRGNPDEIDVRTDVYALGVILYEMLTGRRPYEMTSGELVDAVRVICEATPDSLSRNWTGVRRLDPDVETIVGKALEKEVERRYDSAAAFSNDIGRFLDNEAISARPASATYQFKKLVARNRVAATLVASMIVLLIGFSVSVSLLYARSLASEARATREAETARQALGFMTEMYEVSDPSQARGETVTAREILDRGAERIERELAGQPAIQSTLMETMGQVYSGLGLYGRAEGLLGSAVATRRELLGEEHPDVLQSATGLAEVLIALSRYGEAEELLRQTIERQRRAPGPEHADTLASLVSLSHVLEMQSKLDEAETVAVETLETAQRVLGGDHELTLSAITQLGLVHWAAGRYEEAEPKYLHVLEARRRMRGDDHPETLSMINNLAELYMMMGRFEESERLFAESQETTRRTLGDEHREFLLFRANLGRLYREQGRLEEAERVYRSILEVQRRTLGDEHRDTLVSLNTLGVVLANQGRFDEAEPHYLEALDGLRRLLGEHHEETITTTGNLGMFYLQTGRMDEAERWVRRAHEGSVALHGEDHPTTILRLENLANVTYRQGDLAGAADILGRVLEGRRRALGNDHPAVTRTLINISVVRGNMDDLKGATAAREELLERTRAGVGADIAAVAVELEKLAGDLDRSEEYERSAECFKDVLRIRKETLGADDPQTLAALLGTLRLAVKTERWAEVESAGSECYEEHVRVLGEEDSSTAECVKQLVKAYEMQGDEEKATAWRAKQ